MKNIYNKDLVVKILANMRDGMKGLKFEREGDKLTVSHEAEDWDFICILAQRLGFVTERWMENQEPRTNIYLN